ncbi:GTD-binding domain, partial [Dillenia turbinata]
FIAFCGDQSLILPTVKLCCWAMDLREISSVKAQKGSHRLATALTSAVFEWWLIFMLFIHAIYSYLVTKFAHYNELQVPCLLCSRLDHVLGNAKLKFYWDLICSNHKLEISSMVLCIAHNKLVNVHSLCENCLFSFATINKSNAETYRLLVGKLGSDPRTVSDQDLLVEDDRPGSLEAKKCACCSEKYVLRGYVSNLLQSKSSGLEVAELDQPFSGALSGHDNGKLKKRVEKPSTSARSLQSGNGGFDHLSHIGYTEVKITSDTESEVPFSDDDDHISALVHETYHLKENLEHGTQNMEPHDTTLSGNSKLEKLISLDSEPEPAISVREVQLDMSGPHNSGSLEPNVAESANDLEETHWQGAKYLANPHVRTELISFDDGMPSLSNSKQESGEVSRERGTEEACQESVNENEDVTKTCTEPSTKTETVSELNPSPSDTSLQVPNHLDLGDAYRLAVANRGRQLSGMLAEQWSGKDSALNEDLKLLLSQISASRGMELFLNNISPRVSGSTDDLKPSVQSSSIELQKLQKRVSLERNDSGLESVGLQILQKRASLERNDSGLESFDGSMVSEIEGESLVDRLKRQIEHDRKVISSLYKELDEERNASTDAANQALAMITRLQEEKATLQTEGLQCLRMMEEQSEYDLDALQKANDLLAEKETVIQDLEAELEFYRNKFPNKPMIEKNKKSSYDLESGEVKAKHLDDSSTEDCATVSCNLAHVRSDICDEVRCNQVAEQPCDSDKSDGSYKLNKEKSGSTLKTSVLEFENERLFILQSLKEMEMKLHLFSGCGVRSGMSNGEHAEQEVEEFGYLPELSHEKPGQRSDGMEVNGILDENIGCLFTGSHSAQDGKVSDSEDPQYAGKVNLKLSSGGEDASTTFGEADTLALVKELSNLNNRLKALEADRNFLEHTINSLRAGDEGVQFIQEIAFHLRELRRIGIRSVEDIA